MTVLERLLSKVSIEDCGCWKWQGACSAYGYGCVKLNGETLLVHRLMYELCKGDIPKGQFVCHTCDTAWCVNPEHLFTGTQTDNMKDMALKGRSGQAKITRETVIKIAVDIRLGKLSLREIAEKHGLSKGAICDIKAGRSWKHELERSELEIKLEEIKERGVLVNNLFQLDSGAWQANLRSATHSTVFAHAPNPAVALSLALDLLESAEPFPEPVPIVAYDEPARPSLASLLSARAQPTLVRRI